jgi:hypothetical protein
MSPEKTPRAAEAQNLDAAAEAAAPEAAAAEAADAAEDTNRGVNTRKNPQMQKTARDGQRHWHDKVQEMRIQYDLALTGMVHPQFAEQRFMCTVRNLKCQKESLLMFLQFALQQRLLTPLPFVHPSDENSSFLGWTEFQINPGCGPRFRAGVESLTSSRRLQSSTRSTTSSAAPASCLRTFVRSRASPSLPLSLSLTNRAISWPAGQFICTFMYMCMYTCVCVCVYVRGVKAPSHGRAIHMYMFICNACMFVCVSVVPVCSWPGHQRHLVNLSEADKINRSRVVGVEFLLDRLS